MAVIEISGPDFYIKKPGPDIVKKHIGYRIGGAKWESTHITGALLDGNQAGSGHLQNAVGPEHVLKQIDPIRRIG